MKVTFPRRKNLRMLKGAEGLLFVVICQYRCGGWGFASFWGLPYAAREYKAACQMRNAIAEDIQTRRDRGIPSFWTRERFAICKIQL